ncbi:MAG: FMN-binding protein [Clostridia bacterium]
MIKKKFIIGILFALILVAIVIGVNLTKATRKVDALLLEDIKKINLTEIEDNTYTGFYDAGLVKVEVEVEVVNNEITGIDLMKHTNGKGEPGEAVIENILENQSLQVDTIAGATISSKAIIKAVENALDK